MKVLLTGITGFAGSHLADLLIEQGYEVHGTRRWRSPLANIQHILNKITLHDCDLRDLSSLVSVLRQVKPDRIHHLAAQSYVPYSYIVPADTLETNIIGTCNLLEAVRQLDLHPFIHLCSSSEVYGQPIKTPMKETHPTFPISPYGVSKLGEERIAWSYWKAYGMRVVITRAFTHTGARQHEVFVCSSVARQIALIEVGRQKPVIQLGNLESVRTFLDVRDMVRAYTMLYGLPSGEAYNIAGVETMSIGEMTKKMINLATVDTQIESNKALLRPTDVTLQIADTTKFRDATGWKPWTPFKETLLDLLDYWRRRRDNF